MLQKISLYSYIFIQSTPTFISMGFQMFPNNQMNPEPEVPSIPFDVQLASDLYVNVGLHTWPKYSEL